MTAVFTLDDVAALYGRTRRSARLLFSDEGGPLPKLHGRRVCTPMTAVLVDLQLTRQQAAELLEGEAA